MQREPFLSWQSFKINRKSQLLPQMWSKLWGSKLIILFKRLPVYHICWKTNVVFGKFWIFASMPSQSQVVNFFRIQFKFKLKIEKKPYLITRWRQLKPDHSNNTIFGTFLPFPYSAPRPPGPWWRCIFQKQDILGLKNFKILNECKRMYLLNPDRAVKQ